MTPVELAEIAARANAATAARENAAFGIGSIRRANESTAASQRDVSRLLAVLRERDNTIARVRALHVRTVDDAMGAEMEWCEACCSEAWPCPTIAALSSKEGH